MNRIAAATVVIVLACCVSLAAEPTGLVETAPEEGRSVATDGGIMVPYKMTIPGTDATYSMQPIPGGKFKMGSPGGEKHRDAVEGPQVEVTIEPFWMGTYEVTWAEYKEFMNLYAVFKDFESKGTREVNDDNKADAITTPTELYDPSFTFEFGDHEQQPAVTMTQYAAKQYTKWLSAVTGHQYRLPSEAEWEYACRAGTTTAYHFGDSPSKMNDYGWFFGNSGERSRKVGKKKPNPWGLYDMHGNVWEWVLDEYIEDGYTRLEGGTTAAKAVAWPTKLFPRVVRGGSWDDDVDRLRSAAKMGSHDYEWKQQDPNLPHSPWWFTDDPARGVGFRIIRPLKQLPKDAMAKYWDPDVEEIRQDVANRLSEGRGVLGLVDKELPSAIDASK